MPSQIAPHQPSRDRGLHRLLTDIEGILSVFLSSQNKCIYISRINPKMIAVSPSNTKLN